MAKVEIDKDKCKGCQLCIAYCPTKKIILSDKLNKKGVRFAIGKEEVNCMGCGFCFYICPDSCIQVYRE